MLDMQAKSGGSVDGLLDPGQGQEPVPIIRQESEQSLSETVLIVDDNADIRAYLRTILQDRYQVSEAVDGQQGLTVANEIVPDLIVSDVMMPVMNGLEFCQRIKGSTATSHIPVILLTARALSKHQIEGYESGADAYITKPFAADLLLARISNLLKSRIQLKNLFATALPTATAESIPELSSPTRSLSTSSSGEETSASGEETSAAGEETSAAANSSFLIPHSSLKKEDSFLLKFRDFIARSMSDSDLSVETIGAELGLSRVQLYRKVKALTGQSPVELLRRARLQRGRQLLQSTDKTVSEVAYEVGFSAPSYFTKCFKDEYGVSPSDL
jgi:DNA-binding response OmpR family regulator